MNKAKSFTEFYNILKTRNIPGYNIGYADKNDTIFIFPMALSQREMKGMTGKSSSRKYQKTLWNEYYEITELPRDNPKSGFVYNANHSPFKSTSEKENPDPKIFSNNGL